MRSPEKDQSKIGRRDFLRVAGRAGAAIGIGLVALNTPGVIRALLKDDSENYPATPRPIDSGDIKNFEIAQTPVPDSVANFQTNEAEQILKTQPEAKIETTNLPPESPRLIKEFDLWQTINLANSHYPVAIVAVLNNGEVVASPLARPFPFSEENEKVNVFSPYKASIYTYLAWDSGVSPQTWAHAGQLVRHEPDGDVTVPLFAGPLEHKLRSPNGRRVNADEAIKNAKELFDGATLYLCQAKDPAFFQGFPWRNLPVDFRKFRGNVLTMKIQAMLRVPHDKIAEYEANVGNTVGWAQANLTQLGGFGFDKWKDGSWWGLKTCSGSAKDENPNEVVIDWARWYIGAEILEKQIKFDPSV